MVEGNLAYKYQVAEKEIDYSYLPEPLKHTSVSLLDVFKNKLRLEASAFSIDSKIAKDKILNCRYGYSTITGASGICKAYRPGITKRNFVQKKNGVPMFTPAQIIDLYPKPYKFLSKEQVIGLADWIMVEGELALTCSGTVGNVSMVSKTLKGKVFSQNMIRLYNSNYLGYVYAFFQTPEGKAIITSNNYGAVIQHIDPDHLDNVIIPNAPDQLKKEIHDLILKSYDLRDESNDLIDQAEQLLYEELQLEPIEELKTEFFDDSVEVRNYTTKLSDLKLRMEASFHVPSIKSILKSIKSNAKEVVYIGDKRISSNIILPGRFKRIYVEKENGIPFFGGKQLLELNPSNIKYLSFDQHSKRISEQLFLKENMIAVTCSGTIGKVNIIPKHWENWTLNQHVMRIVPASGEMAGYIFCWLNTELGHRLITRHTYGSVVDEIDDRHLSKVEIPLLKDEQKQKKINNLVLKANKLRYQAHIKEQDAIKKMEDIINTPMMT